MKCKTCNKKLDVQEEWDFKMYSRGFVDCRMCRDKKLEKALLKNKVNLKN